MNEFILPSIGEGIETVSVTEILIKKNQEVSNDDILLLVETDKASMEIPANFSGVIKKIHINVGDFISPNQKILDYLTIDSDSISETKEPTEDKIESTDIEIEKIEAKNVDINETKISTTSNNFNHNSHATPSVKKLARELGCDISKIKGTGINNRITKEDLHNYINSTISSNKGESTQDSKMENTDFINNFSQYGKTELLTLNKIQKTTANRLTESWNTIPHVTQFDEADVTDLDKIVKLLKKININKKAKVSYLPFFIKIVTKILMQLNLFNSSLLPDNRTLIQKHYYNIGIAVDTKMGLLVPVIKNTDKKSIKTISIELTKLVNKARNGKLTIDEMSGGCFTISSLGNIGGKFFTPIINPPEVAILGISSIAVKPILKNNKFVPRKILPISLSYDHRVINGSDAAKFTKMFSEIILDPSEFSK